MSNRRRFRRAMVVFAAAACPLLAGCSEDLFQSRVASIDGQVVNIGTDDPIFGVKIGALYRWNLLSASVAPSTAGVPASVGVPLVYPNPVETPNNIQIRVSVSEPTTARIEIRGFELGVTGTVALLYQGPVHADTTVVWNGRDGFTQDLVPNGMYLVRVDSPLNAEADEADKTIIVNRSASQMEVLDAFNTVSGGDGDYVLDDLAVGRSFTAANSSGQALGQGLLADEVTVVFRDPDYQPKEEVVEIGPNETVEQLTRLTPVISAPQPVPDSE